MLAAVAACAWALLVVSAPRLAISGGQDGAAMHLSAVTYLTGSLLCHQQPSRSFHLAGAQLPVCARCTGLYLAGAWGALAVLVSVLSGWSEPVSALARRFSWRAVLLVALIPMAASVGLEWVGAWAASNTARALSAVPAGWAVGAMVTELSSFRGRL